MTTTELGGISRATLVPNIDCMLLRHSLNLLFSHTYGLLLLLELLVLLLDILLTGRGRKVGLGLGCRAV